ncbi:hypothetical protein BGX34_007137 [Mortierella sp. NVP85]|nr:hypothetical protein BGX34_007137 [Mortierella sp. NVP85]
MRSKSTIALLLVALLASGALAQQPCGGLLQDPCPTTSSTAPVGPTPSPPAPGTTQSTAALTSSISTAAPVPSGPPTRPPATVPRSSSLTDTASSSMASPTQTTAPKDSDSKSNAPTIAVIVGSVIVAAGIGIWVFRKWMLSPSRDFQSKIRGDDYTDYPRSYESDTVHLRPLDQPAEPAAAKTPYNANATYPNPNDDQYYDPNYANNKDQGRYGGQGQGGYGQGDYGGGYDQGYDHGYNNQGYGHGDYNQGGGDGYGHGHGHGHGDYAPSQVGGYAPSQAGGYGQGGYPAGGGGYQRGGY